MPLPEGHWQAKHESRPLGRRERVMLAVVAALIAALAVAFVVSLASTSGHSGRGCVDVTVQAATGSSELRRCGAEARALCANANAVDRPPNGGGSSTSFGTDLKRECRRAGLPVAG